MNEQKKKVPDLRFKGFTDDWEQRKFLNEIDNIIDYRGRTPKKLGMSWSQTGYLALSALNVKNGWIDKKSKDSHFGNQVLYDAWMKNTPLYKGQVVFTTEAPMGNVAQIPDNEKYILSQRTIAFKPSQKLTDGFLADLLSTNKVQNKLKSLATGGTAKGVSQKSLKFLKIIFPSMEEQKTIHEVIKRVHILITLQQRKLDLLNQLKKGLLQKMFADKDSKRPILRFEGFNDDWERRKLGEYFPNILSGNRLPKTMIVKGDVPYVIATTENNGVGAYLSESQKDYSNNNMKKFDRNSITVSIDNPEAIFIQTKTFVASNVMRVLHNSKLDFDELNFFKQILKIKAKGFDWSSKFSGPVIKNISFFAPSDNKEMQKIGKVITNLDSLIALHQRKQNHLKLLKKSLLQQMFM